MELESSLAVLLAAGPIREPLVPLWVMELLASVFLYAWLFCVGACVGSFLNVVIYRLPRGKSLVHPGSLCPHCGHAIRLADNIPILSWLVLGGRCRDCKGPISSRYVFVELAVAIIFLGVALVETKLTGGFPRRNWDATRWLITPLDTLPFWSAYALHVVLLATLLGAALIDYDGFQTPGSLFLPVIIAALALSALWPALFQNQAFIHGPQTGGSRDLSASLAGWGVGLMVGAAVGGIWMLASRHSWPRFAPAGLFVAAGVVMGWEKVLESGSIAMLVFTFVVLAGRLVGARGIAPLAGVMLAATMPWLLDLDVRLSLPLLWRTHADVTAAGMWAATIALSALAAGLMAPPQYFVSLPAGELSQEAMIPS